MSQLSTHTRRITEVKLAPTGIVIVPEFTPVPPRLQIYQNDPSTPRKAMIISFFNILVGRASKCSLSF